LHIPADAHEGIGVLVEDVLEAYDEALELPRALPGFGRRQEGIEGGRGDGGSEE